NVSPARPRRNAGQPGCRPRYRLPAPRTPGATMTLPARHDGDMYRAAVLLSLASVLLAALALISCLSVEDKSTIRGMPRCLWVLVILLLPLVGPAAWFLAGRPGPPGRSPFGWSVPGWPEPPRRPKAPDDDPDFLRSLSRFTPN